MTTIAQNATKLSRRKFIVGSAAAGGGLALGFHLPFAARRAGAARRRRRRGQRLGRHPARRHLRDPHRALRDGAGHAHRPRPARRRGARVRLEEGDDRRSRRRAATSRASAPWGDMSHRRQPRHPHVAGLRAPRRRGRAHDAAAGRRRRVEGAGRRADRSRTASSRTRSTARTISYGKVAAAAAKLTPPDPKTIKLKDPKDWKIAGKPLKRLDTADKLNGSKVYAIDVKLPGMLQRRDQGLARCSAASS